MLDRQRVRVMGAVAGGERPLTTNTRQIESWRQEGEVMLILLSYDSTYYLAVCSWNILRYSLGARCARAPSSMLQVARSERGRHAERFQRRGGLPARLVRAAAVGGQLLRKSDRRHRAGFAGMPVLCWGRCRSVHQL